MTTLPLTALITLLVVALMFWTAIRVGKARAKYDIKAPATTGHEMFDRAYRIQMNTLESALLFLPSMWLYASLIGDIGAGVAGLDSQSLRSVHPRLITCDISGYGTDNAASNLKAYDMLVQCETGLAGITGVPEACGRIGVSICDIGAGLNATIGILAALAQRARTGKGCGVAISLFDGAADWMTVPYVHEVYGQGDLPW